MSTDTVVKKKLKKWAVQAQRDERNCVKKAKRLRGSDENVRVESHTKKDELRGVSAHGYSRYVRSDQYQ